MENSYSSISHKRRLAGMVLMPMGSLLFVASLVAKFAYVPKVVTELAALGFDGDRAITIAILELLGAVLFLVRSTRSIDLLLVSAYMGGAIATHGGHGSSPMPPAFVLLLLWLNAYLGHPQILWSVGLSSRSTIKAIEVGG